MNNKKLAAMIKSLREAKMKQIGSGGSYEGSGADVQDPASPNRAPGKSTKEIHHGVKEETLHEFKRGAVATNYRVAKKLTGPRMASQSKLGHQRNKPDRYRFTEEKKEKSNTKSTMINTTPEQDSAMIGTQ